MQGLFGLRIRQQAGNISRYKSALQVIAIFKHTSYHTIVTVWPTIKKLQELFNKESNKAPGLKYEKSGEQLAEEKWFAQVKNPNNGEFFQLEDLRAVGAVPADFRKNENPKKYPVKKVDSTFRIKKANGNIFFILTFI